MNYMTNISASLGVPVAVFAIALIWTAVWKLLAMWKAAQKKSPVWFILLAIINTVGILPILYIFIFSEMGKNKPQKAKRSKKK